MSVRFRIAHTLGGAGGWAALFLGLAVAAQTRVLDGPDEVWLGYLAAVRPAGLSDAANWIFRLGSVQVDLALAVVWAAVAVCCRRPLWVAVVPLVLFLAVGAQAVLRVAVDRPGPGSKYALHRPLVAHPAGYVLDQVDARARETFVRATATGATASVVPTSETRGSFPSGHAARSLLLAFLAVGELSRSSRYRGTGGRLVLAVPIGLGVLVGLTPLYFGYHWPSDVVGGWLLAVFLWRAIEALPVADGFWPTRRVCPLFLM